MTMIVSENIIKTCSIQIASIIISFFLGTKSQKDAHKSMKNKTMERKKRHSQLVSWTKKNVYGVQWIY